MTSAPKLMLPLVLALLLLQACSRDTEISDAWIRLPPVEGRPAAIYFDIKGGSSLTRLVDIQGPFRRAELHETVQSGSMTSMQHLHEVELKAGEEVSFEPGGKHAMAFGIDPSVNAGDRVELRFYNEYARPRDGSEFRPIGNAPVEAIVVGPGDQSPYDKNGLFGLW